MKYQVTEHEDIERTFQVDAESMGEAKIVAFDHAQLRTADESEDEVVGSSHTFEVSVGVYGGWKD